MAEILHQLIAYPIIDKVYTSQLVQDFFHQQYQDEATVINKSHKILSSLEGFAGWRNIIP